MVFIKKVLIQGFKSYKDQTKFEEFNEGLNVVVGRNGSGKSNFFFAIRFVLSDMFTNLRSEDRQRLLHEGSGDTVLSASVEIHFDNSDGRFPIDKDEVVLRRSIGMKKDEYFLDKKHVTKHDVINLLESAGFSKANPYYIVQQGKVTALALMKDSERLDLLKEVAGTRVYDERREESVRIMQETDGKRENIKDTLKYIEDRMKELSEESKELEQYLKVDKQRRALEYSIYDKELDSTLKGLEAIDLERSKQSDSANSIHKKTLEKRENIRKLEKSRKTLNNELSTLKKEKSGLDEEKGELIKEKARLELDVKDTESKIKREKENFKKLDKERKELEKQVKETSGSLSSALPEFNTISSEEKKLNDRLIDNNRRIGELYAKQGRSSQFATKKERDAWIKNELKQIDSQLKAKTEQIDEMKTALAKTKSTLENVQSELEKTANTIESDKQVIEKTTKSINKLKDDRDALANKRKELWKTESELSESLQQYKTEKNKHERLLQSTMPKVISGGLNTLKYIVEQYKIKGVYGPIIDLLKTKEHYYTAVEVTAGAALFYVVVDTDETVSKLLEIMNKEKGGRVTFIPLNQVSGKKFDGFPKQENCAPLMSVVECKDEFKKAFNQIFGRTLLCQDIVTATKLSRENGIDCVTIDGDQVNRKGGLTGGFYDVRTSRLDAMNNIKQWTEKAESANSEHKKAEDEMKNLDQEISNILGEIQKLESERSAARGRYENNIQQHKQLSRDIQASKELNQQTESTLSNLEASRKQLEENRKSLQSEMGTDLLSQLNEKEQAELVKLNEEVAQIKTKIIEISTKRTQLESEKTNLENRLSNNLQKRLQELTTELDLLRIDEQSLELEQRQKELASVQAAIDSLVKRSKELDQAIDAKNTKLSETRNEVEKIKNEESEEAKKLQSESEKMEKLLNKKSILLQKKDELERKVREIGSLPTTEVESYKGKDLKDLMKRLHTTNQELKGFSNINKKAGDQYVHFSEQRSKLVKRRQELDEGANAIGELIQVLDKQKDEAIGRTFKQVAQNFHGVFGKLVPGGKASLLIQKRTDGGATQDSQDGEQSRISQYTGIAIRVSFSGIESEYQMMQQLSGGQKSVVALALIFAIQKCDPAPFYLFDEIDSALDSTHRAAVADLIKEFSEASAEEKAQFIVSTFRPEIVQKAHKWYGVSYQNKESSIGPIPKEAALKIIQEEAEQEVTGGREEPEDEAE